MGQSGPSKMRFDSKWLDCGPEGLTLLPGVWEGPRTFVLSHRCFSAIGAWWPCSEACPETLKRSLAVP
jgi:hypothetical protein